MATSDPKLQDRLVALGDFVADIDGLSDHDLDEHLRADGIDPAKAVARILARVHRETWLDANKAKRASPVSNDTRARDRAARMDRQQLLALIHSPGARVSAQFRKNEEELSDDDLRKLAVHAGLLDGE